MRIGTILAITFALLCNFPAVLLAALDANGNALADSEVSGAPEWGLRFVITPLFPTDGKPAAQRTSAAK